MCYRGLSIPSLAVNVERPKDNENTKFHFYCCYIRVTELQRLKNKKVVHLSLGKGSGRKKEKMLNLILVTRRLDEFKGFGPRLVKNDDITNEGFRI